MPTVLLVATIFLLTFTADDNSAAKPQYQWNEYGYVLYCPCMGKYCLLINTTEVLNYCMLDRVTLISGVARVWQSMALAKPF